MAREATLMLLLTLASEVPPFPANPLECREDEFLDEGGGTCSPCKQCGPGLQLSQECGFGEGSRARCVPCPPQRFKAGWGHQGCKPCASCGLINRVQRSNCTASSDAACGECFPGFYSKAQIGGFRGLECVPCTKQTPASELQCRARVSLVKVESRSAPAQDWALVAVASGALALVLLVVLTLAILYCRRSWKRQCQRVLFRSQSLPVPRVTFQASALPADFSCHDPASEPSCFCTKNGKPLEGPLEAGPCLPGVELSGFRLPGCRPDSDPPAPVTLGPKAPPARNALESQPLLRGPGGSGGSSLAPRGPPGGRLGLPAAAPLSFCATERQPCWAHVPVECTETDLQAFSIVDEGLGVGHKGKAPEASACPAPLAASSAPKPPPSFQNPIIESRKQAGSDIQSLLAEIRDVVQDLPVAALPPSLVLSLAARLDPALPGLKNSIHLGEELRVPSHALHPTPGFVGLVANLAQPGSEASVVSLAQALQRLRRFDAFFLLHDHFVGNRAQNAGR